MVPPQQQVIQWKTMEEVFIDRQTEDLKDWPGHFYLVLNSLELVGALGKHFLTILQLSLPGLRFLFEEILHWLVDRDGIYFPNPREMIAGGRQDLRWENREKKRYRSSLTILIFCPNLKLQIELQVRHGGVKVCEAWVTEWDHDAGEWPEIWDPSVQFGPIL